jgi:hypothetical protein
VYRKAENFCGYRKGKIFAVIVFAVVKYTFSKLKNKQEGHFTTAKHLQQIFFPCGIRNFFFFFYLGDDGKYCQENISS